MHELAVLLAKRFIQRRDVKAVQRSNGEWSPDRNHETGISNGPFKMHHIIAHLEKKTSYGHYLLDADSMTRLIAFDIDFEKTGSYPVQGLDHLKYDSNTGEFRGDILELNPREAWLNRAHDSRPWSKYQLRMVAHIFASTINKTLELPVAVAYSGCKGVHVYAFTGPIPGQHARDAIEIVMDAVGVFEAVRGNNFFKHKDPSPVFGYPNLSVETFPKQPNLDGKDLGNLMRLPLGVNLKNPRDTPFFIDMTAPMSYLVPHKDPIGLLESGNPWA